MLFINNRGPSTPHESAFANSCCAQDDRWRSISLQLGTALGRPAFFDDLLAAPQRQCIGRNILRDARSRPNVGALSDANRRNQGGIASNERAVFNHGAVLVHAIVIAGDGARPDVDAFANLGVAKIGEVVGLGTFAQPRLLGLHEVADVRAFADVAPGPQMRIRSKVRAVAHHGIFQNAARPNQNPVADFAVGDDGVRANAAVGADLGLANELDERLDHGVRANLNVGIDVARLGTEDGRAGQHQLAGLLIAKLGVQFCQFDPRVDPEHFAGVGGGQRQHLFAGLDQQRYDVGQVVLVMSVVGLELADVGIERLGRERVHASVDLALLAFRTTQRFLFDDALDFVAHLAFDLFAENSAVSRRIGRLGGEYGH